VAANGSTRTDQAAGPVNPLEDSARTTKTRFSERARTARKAKTKVPKQDKLAPEPPDSAEVADRETQAGPLGLAGDTASKKKKKATTVGIKTRLSKKKKDDNGQSQDVPLAVAPAPAPQPAPAPKQ